MCLSLGLSWFYACAQGDELGTSGDDLVFDSGVNETGPMPSGTATSPMPSSSSPIPVFDAMTPDDGGADAEDPGPAPTPCAVGLKSCGGICVAPAPGVGCSLDDCTRCPMVENGTVACVEGDCEATCEEGYVLSGDACVTSAECSDGVQNNAETDVDCGGGGCPRCEPGDVCEEDDDCARGPCESGVCGCTPRTCEDVTTCGQNSDDGCGGTIDCRDKCSGSEVCFNDACCTPATQCPAGSCSADDGCGGTVDCSDDCPSGQVCHNNACCTPQPCPAGACGSSPDGCGGTRQCGNCGGSDRCVSGTCCTPLTVANCPAGRCGQTSDGCGGMIDCGGCSNGQPCTNGTCCTPTACTKNCGFQSDGCGGNACTLCGSNERCDNDQDCQSNDCEQRLIGGCGLLLARCCG